MSADKRVPGRSDEDVRRIADRTKNDYGASRRRPVNIIRHLESGSVLTIYGRKRLVFVVVDDDELGDVDAKTEFAQGVVTITCKRGVRDRAEMGVGRDRMTLAHELGHAVLHHSVPLFRLVGAAGASNIAKEAAYTSAEHQAKVFAAAFLIHDEEAAQMANADEISVEFGVSLQAAAICFDRLIRKAERQRTAARVRRIADQTINQLNGQAAKPSIYLDAACGSCHRQTLIPIGSDKVLCDTCGFAGDRFQDGDPAA